MRFFENLIPYTAIHDMILGLLGIDDVYLRIDEIDGVVCIISRRKTWWGGWRRRIAPLSDISGLEWDDEPEAEI